MQEPGKLHLSSQEYSPVKALPVYSPSSTLPTFSRLEMQTFG